MRQRELLVVDYKAMALTALQWIFEIVGFRARMEKVHGKCSHAEIAAMYQQQGGLAKDTEAITENSVENAMRGPRMKPMLLN